MNFAEKTNKQLLDEYVEVLFDLSQMGDSMAASQAMCGLARKYETEILNRMEKQS